MVWWFVPAILAALFASTTDVFSKKSLKDMDEYVVAWALRFFTSLLLLPLLFFVKIPVLGGKFWLALLAGGGLMVITTLLYMKAIKASDLSLTIPMITFTPLFLLVTSPLILGEFPGVFGIVGIFLIVLGSYVLNIKEKSRGYLAPFKALLREKGPRLMLLVAFIWSISSNIDKVGVLDSSPIFWAIATNIFATFCLFPIMLCKSREKIKQIPNRLHALVPIGLFSGLMFVCQMTAITLTLVAYAISVKRMGAVFGVVFGCLIFKEKGIMERLTGTIIMVLGVLLIALLG